MNAKRLRTSVAAAMGGAVLLAGLLVGASFALAQETEEPEIAVEGDTLTRGFHLFREGARMLGGGLERIAEELGTTPDELWAQLGEGATLEDIATAAGVDLDAILEQVHQEALAEIDQQVEDGNLTQEQADSIKERIESHNPGDGFMSGLRGPRGFRGGPPEDFDGEGRLFGGMRGPGGFGGFFGDLDLGVDLAELGDLLKSGMTLDEALDSLGVDLDALVADATELALAHIDELVAEGKMTQDQADQIKERIEGIDLTDGFPFGLRGLNFDCDLDMDGFGSHHGNGFGFFGDEGVDDTNAEEALLNV